MVLSRYSLTLNPGFLNSNRCQVRMGSFLGKGISLADMVRDEAAQAPRSFPHSPCSRMFLEPFPQGVIHPGLPSPAQRAKGRHDIGVESHRRGNRGDLFQRSPPGASVFRDNLRNGFRCGPHSGKVLFREFRDIHRIPVFLGNMVRFSFFHISPPLVDWPFEDQ